MLQPMVNTHIGEFLHFLGAQKRFDNACYLIISCFMTNRQGSPFSPRAAKSITSLASFLFPTATLAIVIPCIINFPGKAVAIGSGVPSGTPTLTRISFEFHEKCTECNQRPTYQTTVPPNRTMSIACAYALLLAVHLN